MAWRLIRKERWLSKHQYWLQVLLASLWLSSTALAAATLPPLTQWTDDSQQTWTLPAPLPQRWVVLGPHLVDMMLELKLQHLIVGVQDDHEHIGRWQYSLSGFPVVAQASQINEEQIRRARPDLVLYWPSGLAGNQQARLRALGVPLLAIDPKQLDAIAPRLRWLGALAGRGKAADQLAQQLHTDLIKTQRQYAPGPRLRGLYQVWLQPLYSLAPQHLVSQAMSVCGVDSIVPQTQVMAPTLNLEFVLRAKPEVILLSQDQLLTSQQYWQRFNQIPAVQQKRLLVVADRELTRPGLPLLRAIPALCDQLLPYRTLPH